jgi:arylsulfatase
MKATSTRLHTAGTLAVVGSLLAGGTLAAASADAQTVLPRPDPPFKGHIGRTYQDSTPDKFRLIKAPPGAPNVLLVLIDDTGYGAWGTFGGQVATPNLDRIADMGLRYTRFHTTALCSPTRAALITGRNHH